MVTALLVRSPRAAWGVILAFLLFLGPEAAVGQSVPAARTPAATDAPASEPVDAVAQAKISRCVVRGAGSAPLHLAHFLEGLVAAPHGI
jgi:hypothetical protein